MLLNAHYLPPRKTVVLKIYKFQIVVTPHSRLLTNKLFTRDVDESSGRVVRVHQWERLSPHYIPPEWTSGRKLCSVAAPDGRHPRLKVTLVKVFVCRLSIKWVHLSSSDEIDICLTSSFFRVDSESGESDLRENNFKI